MDHTVELREFQSKRVDGWVVTAPQRQILVDGRFIGYCSNEPNNGLNITADVPDEVVEAAKAKVQEFWGEDVKSVSRPAELPDEDEVDDEDEGGLAG